METLAEKAKKLYIETYKKVMEQREEILCAFIAKYGIEPDKITQVEWHKSPTETIWMIKPMDFSVCKECEKLIDKKNTDYYIKET